MRPISVSILSGVALAITSATEACIHPSSFTRPETASRPATGAHLSGVHSAVNSRWTPAQMFGCAPSYSVIYGTHEQDISLPSEVTASAPAISKLPGLGERRPASSAWTMTARVPSG